MNPFIESTPVKRELNYCEPLKLKVKKPEKTTPDEKKVASYSNAQTLSHNLELSAVCIDESRTGESVNEFKNINIEDSRDLDSEATISENDDEFDTTYVPSGIESSSEEDDSLSDDEPVKTPIKESVTVRNERTFLVYERQLYELFKFFHVCVSHIKKSDIIEVPNTGSQLHLKIKCLNECEYRWKSQPTVGTLNGLRNLFLSSSVCFSGIAFSKIQKFAWLLNLQFISDTTYYQLRRHYVYPVIERQWELEHERKLQMLKSLKNVVLIGDGRCDSPGYSAKYCTYTVMELGSGEVVDTVVVPVTEVKNSNAMEKEGFKRIVDNLIEPGVKIITISTDRHVQTRRLLRVDPRYNHIDHQIDLWHIIKGITKKINKAAEKKSRDNLIEWVQSITNHFWWSISTSSGKENAIYERFTSIIYHITNRHDWPGCKHFQHCAHKPLTQEQQRNTKWLIEGTDGHQYLVSVIRNKSVKADLQQVSNAIRTTNVEVFNNLLLKYVPKQYHYEYDHMKVGAYLAAIDHNFNSLREQDTIKAGPRKGELKFTVAYRKPTSNSEGASIYNSHDFVYHI